MNRSLLSIILIIISIAAFFMWINPHYANTKTLGTQLSQSNDALAKIQQLETVRSALVDKENSINPEDLAKLQKLLPDNFDNIRLLIDMQGVASRYGITIQDITIGNNQQTPNSATAGAAQAIGPSGKSYGQMSLSFSVKTSYENLLSFLQDLQNSLRIVEIKSLAFNAEDATPNSYTVKMAINAFWLSSTNSVATGSLTPTP